MKLWSGAPCRGYFPPCASRFALLLVGLCTTATLISAGSGQALAQPRRPKAEPAKEAKLPKDAARPDKGKDADKAAKDDKSGKPKVFDFTGIDLAGRLHTPQLLYFLERANEELERAFLERRSFIPHMVRSLEEEAL